MSPKTLTAALQPEPETSVTQPVARRRVSAATAAKTRVTATVDEETPAARKRATRTAPKAPKAVDPVVDEDAEDVEDEADDIEPEGDIDLVEDVEADVEDVVAEDVEVAETEAVEAEPGDEEPTEDEETPAKAEEDEASEDTGFVYSDADLPPPEGPSSAVRPPLGMVTVTSSSTR